MVTPAASGVVAHSFSVNGWARDVMVCSTGNLDVMVQTRPHVLTPDQVRATAARLGVGLSRGGRSQLPSTKRVPRAPALASSRGRSVVRPLVGLLLMLLLFTGLQTGVYADAGTWISEKYVGLFIDDEDDSVEPQEKPRKRERQRQRRGAQ